MKKVTKIVKSTFQIDKNCKMTEQKAYYFEDYTVGEVFTIEEFSITEEDIRKFAELTYDFNPLHLDKNYAMKAGYRDIISHGLLGVSLCSGLAYKSGLFNRRVLGLISQTIKYKRPVYPNEKLKFSLKVVNKKDIPNSRGGLVVFDTKLMNESGEILILGEWNILILKSGASANNQS